MRILHIIISTLFIVLLLGCSSKSDPTTPNDSAVSQVNYYPAQTGMATGYIDSSGKIVIPAKFLAGGLFKEGLAPVKNPSLGNPDSWGYINAKGSFKIRPQFYDAQPFSNGMARIAKTIQGDHKFGFIDKTGRLVIKPQFKDARDFSEEFAWVKSPETDMWGLIDKTGRFVTKANIEYASDFSEGFAVVKIKTGYGFVDTNGKLVIQPEYAYAGKFCDGLACVQISNRDYGKYGFIDKNGKMAIKADYYSAGDFSDGLAPVKLKDSDNGPWAYIDPTGKIAIKPFAVGWAGTFSSDGLAPCSTKPLNKYGLFGFIDKTGKVIIEPKYLGVGGFMDGGICQVQLEPRKTAFIDITGKIVFNESENANSSDMVSPGDLSAMPIPHILPIIFVAAFLFLILINSIIIQYAANFIGINDVTYSKCLLAAFCGIALNTLVGAFIRNAGLNPAAFTFSFLIAAAITTTMIKFILNTEWGRAILTYLAMLVIEILLGIGIMFCFAGGACCLIPR